MASAWVAKAVRNSAVSAVKRFTSKRAIENLSLRLAQPLSASGYHFLIRLLPANFFSVGSAQRMKRQRSKNKNLNQSGFGYHVGCPTNGLHTQGRKETCMFSYFMYAVLKPAVILRSRKFWPPGRRFSACTTGKGQQGDRNLQRRVTASPVSRLAILNRPLFIDISNLMIETPHSFTSQKIFGLNLPDGSKNPP